MIYEDLLCMGLSTGNIERYVRLILEKLRNVEVGRLHKVTFAKDMFLEPRALSQIQLASVLIENTYSNLTMHYDGTGNHGHSYTTLTFAKDVLEARALSQIHLALVLKENTYDNLTLHSDGTSNDGHSHTILDGKKRQRFCFGIKGGRRS